jgi:hypothetical protein
MHDTTVRAGYNAFNTSYDYTLYPKSKKTLNSIDLSVRTNQYYSTIGHFIEFNGIVGLDFLFANRREASVSWNQTKVNLMFPTVIFEETGSLPRGMYSIGYFQLKYLSNFLRPFSWGLTLEHGTYYNGRRTTWLGSLRFRAQPWGNFGLDFTYNNIVLNNIPTHPFLAGPTVEIAFSSSIFWTTFLQYNTQLKNFNINSRLQWRFKPLSDLYVVYTDNYLTDGFVHTVRSLVFKMDYWIN